MRKKVNKIAWRFTKIVQKYLINFFDHCILVKHNLM